MAWQSTYNADYTKLLIRQLIAFIQRDQRAALDMVGGTSVLGEITTFQLAPMATPQFPYVMLYFDDLLFYPDAVGSRHYASSFVCEVGVAHQDYQALAELVQDYLRAVDLILMSLPLSDFFQSWPVTLPILGAGVRETTALQYGTVKELFVARHRMGRSGRIQQGFGASALLEIVIDREEN